ncbi:MAG: hypothetical protein K2L83_00420, partial [Muribaculaceae bacterium]|nr:hypothetical protein [Muribaculaceae bacterium]
MPLFPNPFRKRKNNDLPQNPAPTRIVTPIFGSESRPYASTDPAAPMPSAPAAPESDPYASSAPSAPSAPASDPCAQSAPASDPYAPSAPSTPAPDSAAKSAYVRVQEGDDNSAELYPSPYARRSRPIDPDGTALPDARGIYRR